jgi:chromosome segregation ATPase
VIETVMIAAIGFLAASLIALLIIPAVNARAERLARRRVEAQFPLSIGELTAEKDHLRAEFAVAQRRIERKAEEALAGKRRDMEELGRRAVQVETLTGELAGRDARVAALEGELAETRSRLAKTEEELRGAGVDLASIRDTLSALEGAHRATLEELGAVRGEVAAKEAALAETRVQTAATRDALAAREASLRDLEAQRAQALAEVDAGRLRIADLETRLATQTVRGDEFERVASEQRTEISMTRQRLADLSRARAQEEDERQALRERTRALDADPKPPAPDAEASAKALADLRATRDMLLATLDSRVDELRAARRRLAELDGAAQDGCGAPMPAVSDRAPDGASTDPRALEAALVAARADRERLESELDDLRRRSSSDGEAIRAENAELRRRIDEVADQILRATATEAPSAESREFQRDAKRPATA